MFWQPGRFVWGNANRVCSISDADRTEGTRKVFFSREGSFLQKVLGEEDCSFDKPNKKISTKRPVVLAQCPKMQNFQKRNIKFFRSLFWTKYSDGQRETSTDYPAGNVSSKGQKIVAESSTLMKKLKISSNFCFHQMFLWTRENEVLTTRPSLSWPKLTFFSVNCQKVIGRVVSFLQKELQNESVDR